MPYVRKGTTVYKKVGKKLKKKAKAGSKTSAVKMIRLLRGLEHRMKPKRAKDVEKNNS